MPELRSADRASYQHARELLDPLKVSLGVAAAEYAPARTLLGDTPLSTAVEYYLRKHPSRIEHKLTKHVVAEFWLRSKRLSSCGSMMSTWNDLPDLRMMTKSG